MHHIIFSLRCIIFVYLKSNDTFIEYSFCYTRALIPLIQTKNEKNKVHEQIFLTLKSFNGWMYH